MTATVTSIDSRPRSKPVQFSEIVKTSDSLRDWCLLIIEQIGAPHPGEPIDIPTRTLPAAVTRAQASLLDRGYPTEFKEGGEKGFGSLVFA